MSIRIATIGVYGTTEISFFEALRQNGTTHFVDVRRKRGLRGSLYRYANAAQLQILLQQMGIEYLHELDLAPTDTLRQVHKTINMGESVIQRDRVSLSDVFVEGYRSQCLESFDTGAFLAQFPEHASIALFCVESTASGCHRSLAAEHLASHVGCRWKDITPAQEM